MSTIRKSNGFASRFRRCLTGLQSFTSVNLRCFLRHGPSSTTRFGARVGLCHRYNHIPTLIACHSRSKRSSSRRVDCWNGRRLSFARQVRRNRVYRGQIFWHNLSDAQDKARDVYTYLMKNGIFINDKMRAKFGIVHELIWNALLEHQMNEEAKVLPLQREQISKLLADESEALMKELQRAVHERLWAADDGTLTLCPSGPPSVAAELQR